MAPTRSACSSGARFAALLPLLMAAIAPIGAARGQESLRSTFPGRRVGGGTRGDCTARVVAHLVPENNMLGAAAATTLGILEGPASTPRPLQVAFRPRRQEGNNPAPAAGFENRTIPPAPAGVTLLRIPAVGEDTLWESSYQCEETPAGGDTALLSFVSSVAPPAQSLLVSARLPGDRKVELELQKLRAACGATVATAEVASAFGLNDVITREWPARLPVRCP
jgi:hypothetical protein